MQHCYKRARERLGVKTKSQAKKLAAAASKHGVDWKEFEVVYPELYEFLKCKAATGKRVKIYRGHVFILNTSCKDNFTTVYAVPDKFDLKRIENICLQVRERVRGCGNKDKLGANRVRVRIKLYTYPTLTIDETIGVGVEASVEDVQKRLDKFRSGYGYVCLENGEVKRNGVTCGKWKIFKDVG